ncbi:MAG: SCP2 sterol-binding domain-containing protein [Candidatus Binataceae bacterium]
MIDPASGVNNCHDEPRAADARFNPNGESVKKVPEAIKVQLAAGAESGLASIIQQFLEQQLGEFEDRRASAARIRGRLALIATDHEVAVTMEFDGREIAVWDGVRLPCATIAGPYASLLELVQGRTNPLIEHLRGRLKVSVTLRHPLLPLRLHKLMRLGPERES